MRNICERHCSGPRRLRRVLLAAIMALTDCCVKEITKNKVNFLHKTAKFINNPLYKREKKEF